jgi:hypothetical protein
MLSDAEHATVVMPTGKRLPVAGLQNGPLYGSPPPESSGSA